MENPVYTNVSSQQPEKQLSINYLAKQSLEGATKWAKFLAIFNLSIMALAILLISIMVLSLPYAGMGVGIIFMYIIMLGIAAIPLFFLYQFSTKTKDALYSSDEDILADGLNALKNYFLIQGIFAIIGIIFMIFGIIMMIAAGSALMGMGGRGF